MEFLSEIGGGQDQYRPSFFELAAQDQLRDLLAPVARYVLAVFAQRNPRYLLRIVNSHDEFFSIAMFFVEKHYLNTWGASFAENFYGLKRRKRSPNSSNTIQSEKGKVAAELTGKSDKLGKREIRLSLVGLILIPYLRSKAADLYDRLGGGIDIDGEGGVFHDAGATAAAERERERLRTAPLRARLVHIFHTYFKLLYPYVNTSWELYLLAYNVLYLFDKTPFWRPWFRWFGVEVRRMSAEDYRAAQSTQTSLLLSPLRRHRSTGLPPSFLTVVRRTVSLLPQLSFEALKFALPTAIFFFRFLEWWYSPEGGSLRLRGRRRGAGADGKDGNVALRAPPRPPSASLESGGFQNDEEGGKGKAVRDEGDRPEPPKPGECPIHHGPLVNPTALPTGWVACYKCVHQWVSEKGCCPVERGVKVSVGELRKVMG
ncbi:hypothetical protein T439DRAFT_322877 [Meredithblackwellia eburnea MCA 4105]